MAIAFDRQGLKAGVAEGQVRISNGPTTAIQMCFQEWDAVVAAVAAARALKELEKYEGGPV